ncbi:MAG: xanthine dehydrogenase family protein molybdopterin-binding subunit, partial [Alphaproteobacteria bacterium]
MGEFGFGQSVRRVEDDRLIIGKGQFTDDVSLPDQAYAVMVRSPWAHAKILSIDTDDARALAGVMAVYTGADAKAAGLGTIPFVGPVRDSDGAPPIQAI